MHINYRRKNKCRAKHHNYRCWPLAYSLRWYRQRKAKDRRAQDRDLMAHGRFDDLRTHYPRTILWDYW